MLKINKFILIDVLTNYPKLEDDDFIESVSIVPAGIQIVGTAYDKQGKEEKIHLVVPEKECQKYGATVIKEDLKTIIK